MSARPVLGPAARAARRAGSARLLAFAGGAVLTLTYLQVLYRAVDVAGQGVGTGHLLAVVVGSVALAVVFSRTLAPREALAVGAVLLAGGLAGYLLSVPLPTVDLVGLVGDTAALLTGLSILQVTRADVWALGLAPAPVFLTAYFFLRRAYGPGVLTGCLALALFVLTGDAGTVQALVGVLGGAAAVGLGDVDVGVASPSLGNALAVVLVGMLVVTTTVSFVPGGEARPLLSGSGPATIEGSIVESTPRVGVAGSIRLSPTVRFTVSAEEGQYWRVGAYDRFTGSAWVRTGRSRAYDGRLPGPATATAERVRQTFTAESTVSTMPAAWKPVSVDADGQSFQVTDLGGLEPTGSLGTGERYTVTSLVNQPSSERLQRAGTDYPEAVEARYLQLPESTPDRLGEFTTELTASASTPYERAAIIERWLESSKLYALDVDRPDGNVASAFVFEMDRGYCVYYATAMVAMLRTQGVPARFVVGYATGQQVDDDRWVVRGLDSHAWVEVYFPGEGWVRFDPTPAAPRRASEVRRIELARENAEPNVDTGESLTVPLTTVGPVSPGNDTAFPEIQEPDAAATAGANLTDEGSAATGPGGGLGGLASSPEALLYGVVLLLGGLTAVYRTGALARLYRALWLRRLPSGPPARRVVAAVERAEYLLGRRYRPRREGETRRAYLRALAEREDGPDGVDGRAAALFRLGELARYAGRASEADAAAAARLLRQLRGATGRLE